MIERVIEKVIDQVDRLEFSIRFGVSPKNEKAKEKVSEKICLLNKPTPIGDTNIHILLAKKFNLLDSEEKIDQTNS